MPLRNSQLPRVSFNAKASQLRNRPFKGTYTKLKVFYSCSPSIEDVEQLFFELWRFTRMWSGSFLNLRFGAITGHLSFLPQFLRFLKCMLNYALLLRLSLHVRVPLNSDMSLQPAANFTTVPSSFTVCYGQLLSCIAVDYHGVAFLMRRTREERNACIRIHRAAKPSPRLQYSQQQAIPLMLTRSDKALR